MNNLYYGSDHADDFRNASFTFDMDVLQTFLRRIYNGFDTSKDFEPTMWREILRIINEGTVQGLSNGSYPFDTKVDKTFLQKIAHSNEVFSAFKVHDMGVLMAKKLKDSEGNLRSFAEWKKEVQPIASHHCGAWLNTEYNTAILRGQFAAEWKQYEADADIFPNLRWMPTTSATPDEEHKVYWSNRLTLPIGDKFWNDHHPGDHWNCKCSLEQTDEPSNPDVLKHVPEVKAQAGLKANPGKDGVIFDKSHPYFPKDCKHCAFYGKRSMKNVFTNEVKHCERCAPIDNKMRDAAMSIKNMQDVEPPHMEDYTSRYNGMVMDSSRHGNNEREENLRLAKFVAEKLGSKVYLLPRLDPIKPDEAPLRPTHIPSGVFEGKSPDFYIGGKFFDGKSMLNGKYTDVPKKQHNKLLNHIKDAKDQADNMVIEVPEYFSRRIISKTVVGYLRQSSKKRLIIIKHGDKCYVYK